MRNSAGKPIAGVLAVTALLIISARGASVESDASSDPGPMVGFNSKGTLNTIEQVEMLRSELRARENAHRLVLRVDGGTRSQRTYPADWTDEMLQEWVSIQQEFGCKFILNPNFNDTPQSQFALYQRWRAAGAEFFLVELMNEPYLPKFRRAHDHPQNIRARRVEVTPVTEFMTPQKYIELATGFVRAFRGEGIPFAAALAPERDGNPGRIYAAWNNAVIEELNKHANIHATLHLYQRPGETLDLEQIDRIKQRIGAKHLYITEAGVLGYTVSYDDFIEMEVSLLAGIMDRLEPEDLLLSQVLYNDYRRTYEASFHPNWSGITPKGAAILDLFGLRKKPDPPSDTGDVSDPEEE